MKTRPLSSGSALVITLVMLGLLLILLVGFAGRMTLDLGSSTSHLDRTQAELYARMGLDAAQTTLANASAQAPAAAPAVPSTDKANLWLSQPGRLLTIKDTATATVDLSSGSAAPGASADEAADLNPKTLADPARTLVASTNPPMRVRWIYVNQDGTYTAAAPPPHAATNPVVGRFAYWADDESAKVNLNTAWTRNAENTANFSDPSRVELAGMFNTLLTQSDADLVQSVRKNTPYNSLQDARRAGGNVPAALGQQAFSLTHYSHSPELNMFNEPRLVLTTSQALAGGAGSSFFDILATQGTDPGLIANLDATKVTTLVNKLYGYLTNANWPANPGVSFATKYAPGNNSRAYQLAIDLIEYVRCAESATALVEPIRGYMLNGAFVYGTPATADYATSFMGNTRGPRITEIGVYVPQYAATATAVYVTLKFEISLPKNCGISQLNLVPAGSNPGLGVFVAMSGEQGHTVMDSNGTAGLDTSIAASEAQPNTLTPGQYATVTKVIGLTPGAGLPATPSVPPFPRPTYCSLRIALRSHPQPGGPPAIETVPANGGTGLAISYKVDDPTVTLAHITSVSVDDPSVNKRYTDWSHQGASTFSGANSAVSTLGTAAAATTAPPQDTDQSGSITDAGVVFPAPKGAASNPSGVVQSVGELGYVHTGIEDNVVAADFGMPWRTLRLQPDKAGSTTLPDWLLLDLFCVPPAAANTSVFTRPNPRSSGGRINLNASVVPFTDTDNVTPSFTRVAPLQSLLLNATTGRSPVTATTAATLAGNITNHTLATNGRNFGSGDLAKTYLTPGQVAEIAGVADQGESSEALVREVVAAAATRGNVFSVYTVGQAIRQDKSGAIHALSEQRFQTNVERWDDGTKVTYRPIFSRTLTP